MSHNWKGRDAWLLDEDAMLDFYDGPQCPECGFRGDDCACEKPTEEEDDDE